MLRIFSVATFIGIWWLVTDGLHVFAGYMLASPIEVAQAAFALATESSLFEGGLYEANLFGHALISLNRVLVGFGLAVLLALPLGLAIGTSTTVQEYCYPVIQFGRAIPPIAFVPLGIVWFGLGNTPIIFIIFLGAFWAVLTNVITGVTAAPRLFIRAAESLGATRFQIFNRVILPAAFPHIFVGLRTGFGIAWVSIVAGELVAASSGLGYLIMHARRLLASDDVITGMVAIGVLGILFDAGFRALERTLFRHWS